MITIHLRHLDPIVYDRVVILLAKTVIEDPFMKRSIDNWVWSMIISPNAAAFSYIMTKLETYLTEKSKYNFILTNNRA